MYMSKLDIGHKSDDKAVDDDDARRSFDEFYKLAPDAVTEAARLAKERVEPGGTAVIACILGDQAYVTMIPFAGADVACTRSCEEKNSGWERVKGNAYVRVSSGMSGARSIIERLFGRLRQDCKFVAGPMYKSQEVLAYNFAKVHLWRYNIKVMAGEDLFVRPDEDITDDDDGDDN